MKKFHPSQIINPGLLKLIFAEPTPQTLQRLLNEPFSGNSIGIKDEWFKKLNKDFLNKEKE